MSTEADLAQGPMEHAKPASINIEMERVKEDLAAITRALHQPPPFGKRTMLAALGIGLGGIAVLSYGLFPHLLPGTTRFFVLLPSIFLLPILLPLIFAPGPYLFKTGHKDLDSVPLALAIAAIGGVAVVVEKMYSPSFPIAPIMVPAATGLSTLTLAAGKPNRQCLVPAGISITAYGLAYAFMPQWARVAAGGLMLVIIGFGAALILYLQQKGSQGRALSH